MTKSVGFTSEPFVVDVGGIPETDGPQGPRSSRGTDYITYGFGVIADATEFDVKKAELLDYFANWIRGYIAGRDVVAIEWRVRPHFETTKMRKERGDSREHVLMGVRARIDFVTRDPRNDYGLNLLGENTNAA